MRTPFPHPHFPRNLVTPSLPFLSLPPFPGTTTLTPSQVDTLIARLKGEWEGESYSLLTRNCVHFSEALAASLGCGPLPPWVNSLAGGASVASDAARVAVAKAKGASAKVTAALWGLMAGLGSGGSGGLNRGNGGGGAGK